MIQQKPKQKQYKNFWMFKAPKQLKEQLDRVRIERIKIGKDRQMSSYNRLGLAISRHNGFLQELINADFIDEKKIEKMNKKAQTFNIFLFMVVAFLAVAFFAGLIYVMGLINGVFQQVGIDNEVNIGSPAYTNMSLAAEQIFGNLNQSIQALRMVSIVYILCYAVLIMITNVLVKRHPLFFFVYILISLLAVVFAPTISNAYENLLASPSAYGNVLTTFTASNFILLNLPSIVMVISVLGGVFLFINMIRTGGEETGL